MPRYHRDGLELHYFEEGEGPPLVIIPGNTASGICHAEEMMHFAQRYRVLVIDPRGTGSFFARMDTWPVTWWQDVADDIAFLLDDLQLPPAILVGTSGGASIALLAAITHPERVKAVIADSTVEHFEPENLRIEIKGRQDPAEDLIQFWQFAHGDDWEQVVNADSELLLKLADEGGDLFQGRLGTIGCPVLLTGSTADESLNAIAEQFVSMAEQIPDCQTVLANRGGHPFMWTRPALFRSIADEFLDSLDQDNDNL